MKLFVLACVVAVATAEPPRFQPARFRFQRIELAPTTDAPAEPTTEASGPYPASGWKPAGQPFNLPNEQAPDSSYGAPQQQQQGPYPASGWKPVGQPFSLPNEQPPSTSYGVPDNSYGAPDNTYGAPDAEVTTTAAPTTDNPQTEKLEGPVEVQKSIGEYYVLLPDGRLQRIEFVTENDVQNMKYTARLQLRNPAPLFVFGP